VARFSRSLIAGVTGVCGPPEALWHPGMPSNYGL